MTSAIGDDTLAGERRYLYIYAMTRLRDPHLAEDAVQETLIAALAHRESFEGRSSLRTWLVAILRNKIADALRLAAREPQLDEDPDDPERSDALIEALFRENGHWHPAAVPRQWKRPDEAMENNQFWEVFERCLKVMPARLAEAFVLREVMGESIDDICKSLAVSQTNCSVMLFRARARLRGCLEQNWFAESREEGQ
ncbi:MAG: RNA polymerase factor sigma-70 [Rhodocyclaceae bacterium]